MNKLDIDLKELTQRMDNLKDQQAALKFDLKNVEKEIEKCELQLATVLDKAQVLNMDYGVYSFGWKITTTHRFNQKAFGELYPDLLEKFKLPVESKKLEFKINK